MKTVFISILEGVEAKNILRTDAVKTILKDEEVHIVFLVKDEARVTYYSREFNGPRISYAVVTYDRSLGKGFDRFFAVLKFYLLRTKTTNLRRRLAYEAGGNYFTYIGSHILNILLAHRPIRRLARALDYRLVKNSRYREVFEKYKPDLVFLAHLFEESEINILREARHRGIKTIALVNSWDKVTARAIMRLLPDRVIVFNDIVKREMEHYNDMPLHRIDVSGIPQYDDYFKYPHPWSTREEFFSRIKINPKHKLIVYAPMGRTFSNTDWDVLDLLHRLQREKKIGEDVSILVRFQPNDFLQEGELEKRPWLIYDYPGVRFTTERGVDWDMPFPELKHLHDTLSFLDLVICWAGSFGVDASIFDKPVINPDLILRPHEPRIRSPREHYRFEHYEKALAFGGMRLIPTEEELVKWIKLYLNDPAIDREGRAALVAHEVQFKDGKSGERIGNFVLSLLRNETLKN